MEKIPMKSGLDERIKRSIHSDVRMTPIPPGTHLTLRLRDRGNDDLMQHRPHAIGEDGVNNVRHDEE